MIFNAENILLIGSILLFVSIVVSKTGYRFGIPTLLVFLLVGMLFGSDGLGLQFHDAGEAQFIGMMALSIILFSGGMDPNIRISNLYCHKAYCFPPSACCLLLFSPDSLFIGFPDSRMSALPCP